MPTFYEKIYETKVIPNKLLKRSNYSGYPKLKAAGVQIEFTPDQLSEYVKCSKDCIYFIENYVKIVNLDKGLIKFKLYSYQKRILEAALNNPLVLCKIFRQGGKSSCVAAFLLWNVLFNEHCEIAILANKESQAQEILSRIKLSYEELPWFIQAGIVEFNKKNITLANGSKIYASATSASAIRGRSNSLILLDEFAHIDRNLQEDFWSAVAPTISSGTNTKILILSTPKGMELFYKLWQDAISKKNNFVPIEAHWSEMPGRDEKWKEDQLKLMSQRSFDQEYNTEFLGSSNTLIDGSVLRRLVLRTPLHDLPNLKVYEEPIKKPRTLQDNFDPYKGLNYHGTPPEPAAKEDLYKDNDHIYVITVDTARGDNNDFSAFTVLDVTQVPYSVVAVYRNDQISTLIFPNVVYEAARYYNMAYVLIETNDLGQQVADILHYDLEYENIIMTAENGKNGTSTGTSQGFGNGTSKLGVRTTKSTKRVGCSNLKTLVEGNKLLINDFNILGELSRFALKGTSYCAQEGNDDLVMCCVIFSWLTVQPFFKDLTDMDIRKNLYADNMNTIEQEVTPFGGIQYNELPDANDIVTVPSMDAWLLQDD